MLLRISLHTTLAERHCTGKCEGNGQSQAQVKNNTEQPMFSVSCLTAKFGHENADGTPMSMAIVGNHPSAGKRARLNYVYIW